MDIALWSTASLGSLYWILQVRSDIKSYRNQIINMIDTETVSPSKLLRSLTDEKFLASWTRDSTFPNEFKKEYFVEGTVRCDNAIPSSLKPSVETVYLIHFKDDLYSHFAFGRSSSIAKAIREPQKTYLAPLHFSLEDAKEGKSCRVNRSLQVKCSDDVLTTIAEKETKYKLSKSERTVLSIMMAVRGILHLAKKNLSEFKGIKVGVTEKEIGIQVGSKITAYGEVIYDRLQNTIRIERPTYFFSSKSLLKAKLFEPLIWKNVTLILASAVFLGSVFMLGRTFGERLELWAKLVPQGPKDEIAHVRKVTINSYRCKLCNQNLCSIIFKPCLHFVACKDCSQKAHVTACPECRARIQGKIEVFVV